jgi:hypothetical protein
MSALCNIAVVVSPQDYIRFEHPSESTDGDASGGFLRLSLDGVHLPHKFVEGHSLIRKNRINGTRAVGSDDLDLMIQVVSERVPDVGSVRVGIRPQRYLCEHFRRDLDLSIFAN